MKIAYTLLVGLVLSGSGVLPRPEVQVVDGR
jgi:hypothetical protein